MHLNVTNNTTPFMITRLSQAIGICQRLNKRGRIIDEGEVIATVDLFGIVRDLDGSKVQL